MTNDAAGLASEFELKLAGPRAAVLQAFEAFTVRNHGEQVGPMRPARRLSAVYFDTPDRRLLARSAALRVRRENGNFVQALKIARGALDRLEHEATTRGSAPELELLPADIRPVLGALYAEELTPVFATDVQRRRREIVRDDGFGRVSRVELALDEGEVSAGGRTEPILELEVELKQGDRALVFDVGESLIDAGATRIINSSKAARGYQLADGTTPTATKAVKLRLLPNESVGDAFGRIMESVVTQWLANHDVAFDGRDVEGVHQLRVAVRRLRSALTSFGLVLAPERLAWLKGEARWVMAELGPARDLDVFCGEMLPPIAAARLNDAALARLRCTAEDARSAAYERVRVALASPRYARFVLRLTQWLMTRGWHADADAALHLQLGGPLDDFARHVLERRAKAVRKRGRHFADLDIDERHELRKTLKKLRYAVEFFRELYAPKPVKRYLARLEKLQDAFGHMNDMAAAESVLAGIVEQGDARLTEAKGLILGYYAHAASAVEDELSADWQAFAAAEPFWKVHGRC